MAKVDGGELLVKALRREGVENVFALCGDSVRSIFDACIDEGVRIIDTRHDQTAVHMAEGWARVMRQPGVAIVSGGPGAVNAWTGIAVAHSSGSPVILLSARLPVSDFHTYHGQDVEQVPLFRPITKWAATCLDTKRIPEYVSMAFHYACSGRPGPVFLDVPRDVLETKVEKDLVGFPTGYRTRPRPQGEPGLVKAALDMLASAKKPLVIAGSGVAWSQAEAELQKFIEVTKLPLLLSRMGRGSVSEDHLQCFGPLGIGTRQADLILVIGARLNTWLAGGRSAMFGTNQKWIQVDIEVGEIGAGRPIDLGIVGDAREVLRQMIELGGAKLSACDRSAWLEECAESARNRRKRIEADLNSTKVPIHPLRLCKEINDFLSPDAIIVEEGGNVGSLATQVLRACHPGQCLDHGNMGFLGTGIPFGIAAKLGKPDQQVLVLSGDGAFGFNGMEFDTAVRHRISLVTVVANNGAWGSVRQLQQAYYGPDRVVGTELGFTRYDKLVEALGGYGEFVEEPDGIRPALERAFASGLPACINVKVDPTVVRPRH